MIACQYFVPGGINPPEALEAAGALSGLLPVESPRSYARMMLYRLAGQAAGECEDRYFIAMEDGQCVSRIWYGWGRHQDAIGNFGNFRTAEDHQRRGIGRSLLEMLIASVRNSADLPRCLFSTCSQPHLVRMYGALGFRPALEGTDRGCCIVRWETARTVLTASSGNITVRRGPARQRDVSQWSCPRVEPSLLYWTGDSP